MCCFFSLKSSRWCSQLFLLWTLHLSDCVLLALLFLPLTEQRALQTRIAGYFLPSLESPSVSGLLPSFCEWLPHQPLTPDPWPDQGPRFFLFSDGGTLWPPSQLKRINTKVPISSQDLSVLTDWTFLIAWTFLPYHTSSVARFCWYFLCVISVICSFLSRTDTWIRFVLVWLNWLSLPYAPQFSVSDSWLCLHYQSVSPFSPTYAVTVFSRCAFLVALSSMPFVLNLKNFT